jgi:hypothetical protein
MRLDQQQLEFLARFSKSPDARAFTQIIEARLKECESKLRTATGEEVYRNQGRAQELDEILAHLATAQVKQPLKPLALTSRSWPLE